MLDFLGTLKGMSAGQALDIIQRKVQIRRWKQREDIGVRCSGRTAHLRTRPGTTDAEVVWQCFVGDQYEIPKMPGIAPLHYNATQATYMNTLQSGKKPLVIDCGANMGASTVWFDMRFPGSSIIAVEPAMSNTDLLKLNCAKRENVSIVEAGVGSSDGEAYLQDSGGGHWGYQTSHVPSERLVKIVALADLIKDNMNKNAVPFILKIDVEGAEKDLFNHSLDLIALFPVIIFEPHDFYMPGAKTASPFFKFHAETGRDFAFGYENVFSLDVNLMRQQGASI